MGAYRLISQLHESERLVEFAATPHGRVFLWLAATILLLPNGPDALLVSPILALILLFPRQRTVLLAVGALAAYFKIATDRGLTEPFPLLIGIILVLALSYFYFRLALRYKSLPATVQRFPLLVSHLPALLLIGFLWWRRIIGEPITLDPILLAALSLLPFLMWRWSYLLFSGRRGKLTGSRFADHLFYLLPSFGGTNTPFGKGYDYLSSRRADTSQEMSRAQLAGLKLLFLAHLWGAVNRIIEVVVYGLPSRTISALIGDSNLGLTPLAKQLAAEAPGDLAAPVGWAMILVALIAHVLSLATWGHLIVGCLRLFGFNVFRNTYKPLLAESIVEYWNRFFYYFKELLVEFFFYPTFLATARFPQEARVFLSIVAAVFLGNLYYHVIRDMELYLRASPEMVLSTLLPWCIYALLLVLGIFLSMRRQKKRRRAQEPALPPVLDVLVRSRRILGVWLFYGLLLVWIEGPHSITFAQRFEFLLALFGGL